MTLFKFGLVTMGVLSSRLLAPLEISHFYGLRPSMEFLTGLASNIVTGYHYHKVFIFFKHPLRGS